MSEGNIADNDEKRLGRALNTNNSQKFSGTKLHSVLLIQSTSNTLFSIGKRFCGAQRRRHEFRLF